jgi:hypothetical protein
MKIRRGSLCLVLLFVSLLLSNGIALSAQVSPDEIKNPRLKTAEATYFPQIMSLYRAVPTVHTPLPFELSRYVGVDPKEQAGTDSRGIEFVNFHNRVLLKISGNYNAAYNPDILTQNERAAQVFSDVITPIVGLLAKEFPQDMDCDGVGFEISYHVHVHRNFDYEGKEILVAVFDRGDAFAFAAAADDASRQEILNRAEIYVNGNEFGLALNQRNPFDLEALDKRNTASAARPDILGNQRRLTPVGLKTGIDEKPANTPPGVTRAGAADAAIPATSAASVAGTDRQSASSGGDVDRLQSQFQAQLDTLASAGKANWHFVDYAPPTFGLYQNKIVLQLTLRNPAQFSEDSGSIYKRAAQSFDLFLARELKSILEKVPSDAAFEAYDITVLNQFGRDPQASSEAVEYISPRNALAQFAHAEINSQQLIDQTVVLVNGERIALNLQQVE